MLNMEAKTRLEPEEVITRVKDYFGPNGEGLDIESEEDGCLSFCSPLGYVNANIFKRDQTTVLNLLTQEFEYQVKSFINKLP
jgi:hypothetical protein